MEQPRSRAMPTESVNPPLQDSEILIDSVILHEVTRRRLRSWLVLGPVIFGITAVWQLCLLPQSYTASASLSVQQSQGSASALSLFSGNLASKKYIGILHSRTLAEAVERKYHLQQFYHLPSERRAVELLINNIKVEDSAAEGLLFVHMNLTGPARLAPDPQHRREQVKRLVADVANEYVMQLRSYYATSDNDRDSVLLGAAEHELQRARAEYARSSADIRAFVKQMKGISGLTSPTAVEESPISVPSNIQGLMDQTERIQAEISGEEAAQQTRLAGTQRQLGALASIPADDPFLSIARDNLDRANTEVKTLIDAYQLSDDNPRVVTAHHKVAIAREALRRQEEGFRRGLTTDRVLAETRLKSLRAQRDSILHFIRQSAVRLPARREQSIAFIELQKEQEIKLTVLKATEQKAAELRLSAPSAQSRLSVVDTAQEAETGQPTLSRALLLSVVMAVLLFFPTTLWDYLRRARGLPTQPVTLHTLPESVVAKAEAAEKSHTNGTKAP